MRYHRTLLFQQIPDSLLLGDITFRHLPVEESGLAHGFLFCFLFHLGPSLWNDSFHYFSIGLWVLDLCFSSCFWIYVLELGPGIHSQAAK